ncbi:MAG: hypothetical protein U1D96_07840 [Eubacteriales bacterium]|nr:hypothetical protein [Bacillota bacterium]MBV1728216.1 hypothetical protein [Desulforudis sp.]MDP3050488.1 hypothetical protein [Eubacteriales bacterium]MDQ7789855.1 hypothetical protein [Clostridia bacterium]MBU4532366.1 hypothetical protein [Bacillota bacterium]
MPMSILVARLELGKVHCRLCCDGEKVFLEDSVEEIQSRVQEYLERDLEYKTSEWVDGKEVRKVITAAPGTAEHFSALVWHYIPHRAKVGVSVIKNEGKVSFEERAEILRDDL